MADRRTHVNESNGLVCNHCDLLHVINFTIEIQLAIKVRTARWIRSQQLLVDKRDFNGVLLTLSYWLRDLSRGVNGEVPTLVTGRSL